MQHIGTKIESAGTNVKAVRRTGLAKERKEKKISFVTPVQTERIKREKKKKKKKLPDTKKSMCGLT